MPARSPALKAMTAAEKGELLDALLTDQPALQTRVEALAAARMSAADRGAVAEEVETSTSSTVERDIDPGSVMSIRERRRMSFSTKRCSRSSAIWSGAAGWV
jgi:hypothetical protein